MKAMLIAYGVALAAIGLLMPVSEPARRRFPVHYIGKFRYSPDIEELLDALTWCGGSPSFAPGGEAREGWEREVQPLLRRYGRVA